jgi:2-amino-4-hydroxy-6-hydroxymethyldihydropteridine diphosphokinase
MGEEIYETKSLQIPHPEMHKRAFVLVPLCTLKPDWLNPVMKLSVQQMLNTLPLPLNVEPIEL